MPKLEKVSFGVVFLVLFILTVFFIRPWLSNIEVFLNFNFDILKNSLQDFILVTVFIILTSLSFVIFVTVTQDWIIIAPTIFLAAILSLISLSDFKLVINAPDLLLAVALFIGLFFIAISVFSKMQNYLTFKPAELLTSEVKNAITLFLISFTLVYFFTTYSQIKQKGFQIPDSFIDSALKSFTQVDKPSQTTQESNPLIKLPKLSKEEIASLRKNPELLKQRGIDPNLLDLIEQSANQPAQKNLEKSQDQSALKTTVKDTLQNYVKPYQNWIPLLLALVFFSTFSFLVWIPSFFLSPIISGIFALLKASKVLSYKKEMKEVDRLVV